MRAFHAGNANPFADAIAWYGADSYNATTGVWLDKTGKGNNATQATEALRPTIGSDASGRVAVLFGSKFLSVPTSTNTFSFLNKGTGCVFLVGRIATNTTTAVFWMTGRFNSSDIEQSMYFNSNNTAFRTLIRNAGTVNLLNETTVTANAQFLICYNFAELKKSLNGGTDTTFTYDSTSFPTGNNSYNLHIGATANGDFSLPSGSYINELLFLNNMTNARRLQVQNILKIKYGF
jgi:hypothetical protein